MFVKYRRNFKTLSFLQGDISSSAGNKLDQSRFKIQTPQCNRETLPCRQKESFNDQRKKTNFQNGK